MDCVGQSDKHRDRTGDRLGECVGQPSGVPGRNNHIYPRATGPGGSNSATATVNVTAPPPPPPPPPAKIEADAFRLDLPGSPGRAVRLRQQHHPRRRASRIVAKRRSPEADHGRVPKRRISVEGHADERGSAEYNLGLADRRATAAKEFLVQLGVPGIV